MNQALCHGAITREEFKIKQAEEMYQHGFQTTKFLHTFANIFSETIHTRERDSYGAIEGYGSE